MSENHLRDYNLYEKFSKMTPMWPVKETSDPNGYTPLECFAYRDTYGKELPCNDVVKLREIQHGKEMVNLQIKMWVDTTFELPIVLMPSELKEELKNSPRNYPPWVFESYIKQLKKLYISKHGYLPSFISSFL